MAEGVRIRHKTLRSVLLTVRDLSSRIDPPYSACSRCGLPEPGHEGYKTRHFDLDDAGTTIVSTTILEALRRHADHGGFDLDDTNPVPNPPTQGIMQAADGSLSVKREVLRPYAITTTSRAKG